MWNVANVNTCIIPYLINKCFVKNNLFCGHKDIISRKFFSYEHAMPMVSAAAYCEKVLFERLLTVWTMFSVF